MQVRLLQASVVNSLGLEVELKSRDGRRVLYRTKGETIMYFAHVAWAKDGTRFALLVTGTPVIEFAYDTKSQREIPFAQMKEEMAAEIRTAYNLKQDERDNLGNPLDPIQWAKSYRGHEAFFQLHPDAVTK